MTPDQIATFIGTVGVPSAGLLYLIWWVTRSLNGKFDRLTAAIDRNTAVTSRVADQLGGVPE